MNSSCNYIYSIILSSTLVVSYQAMAQEPEPLDTISIPAQTVQKDTSMSDTSRTKMKIGRIGLYADYWNFVSRLISNNIKFEGGLHLMAHKKVFLSVEAGSAMLQPKSSINNGNYRAEGKYWKVGMDYLIHHNVESDSKIYVGIRYAKSKFSDHGDYEVASTLWPSYKSSFSRENMNAIWYEILFGTEATLFRSFYTGWAIRYRMISESPQFNPIPVYNIPGFGSGTSNNTIALNLYLKYMIRW